MGTVLIKAAGLKPSKWLGYVSGIGRSTNLLLKSLGRVPNLPFNIKVYASGLSSLSIDYSQWPFQHFSLPIPDKFRNLKIEAFIRNKFIKYDLYHIPHNEDSILSTENFVITMHDVIVYDEAIDNGNNEVARRWECMAHHSRGIVTCSFFSKSEIVNRFNVDPDKIDVIYWGVDKCLFHKVPQNIVEIGLSAIGVEAPFFLMTSCNFPRKNVTLVLKAFKLFAKKRTSHKLVLIWRDPPHRILDEYAQDIYDGRIVILDSVSDENLRLLYNGASLVLFPSRMEGFGLPILESFSCGTPVLTCRNSSLPEVGGNVAIYTGEDDVDDVVDIMRLFENSEYDIQNFFEKSKILLNEFAWEKTASKYVEFYQKYL